MNSRAKGRRNENRARDLLIKEGWEVERPNFTRFGNKDFFNLWDLVAVKDGMTRWVQVKTGKRPTVEYMEGLAGFAGCGTKELWIFYDRVKEPDIIDMENMKRCDACNRPLFQRKNEKKGDYETRKNCDKKCGAISIGRASIGRIPTKETRKKMSDAKKGLFEENHSSWKKTGFTYEALHLRVRTRYGNPTHCEMCGVKEAPAGLTVRGVERTRTYFEWANMTGSTSLERVNWKMLCLPCHRREDANNPKGGREKVEGSHDLVRP